MIGNDGISLPLPLSLSLSLSLSLFLSHSLSLSLTLSPPPLLPSFPPPFLCLLPTLSLSLSLSPFLLRFERDLYWFVYHVHDEAVLVASRGNLVKVLPHGCISWKH